MEETLEVSRSAAERPHILAIVFPALGHMTPVVQICKMLIAKAGCRVTIACTERDIPSLRGLLPEKHAELHHMKVLPISDGLPLDMGVANWDTFRDWLHALQEGLPRSFALHIQSFSDVVCVISDVYLSWTQDVANQLGVPRFAVWVSAAAEHQVYFHAKELMKAGKLPFKAPLGNDKGIDNMIPGFHGRPPLYHRVDGLCKEEEEMKIPGLPSLNRRDFPTFLQIEESSDECFYSFTEHIKTGLQASMLLFNTFETLESRVLDAMRSQGIPAHPIGPLFLMEDLVINEKLVQVPAKQIGNAKANEVQNDEEYPECLRWLDGQKPKSVMYVAFGSFIHLTKAEAKELALGLLYSGQPFIWAYPKPREEGGRQELPEGFLDQVKGKGLVLEWAPQKRILSHPSTGAFLTHCGWNSTMESTCFGVPTLCLPFVADQYLHCKMMVEEWKVGLRLERNPDEGIALTDDISRLTQELLVGAKGDPLRKRAQELKLAAETSIQPGGSSRLTIDAIINLVQL